MPRIQTLHELSKNGSQGAVDETFGYVVSAIANTTVAGLTEAAARLTGTNVRESMTPGFLSSMFATVKDLFRKEWMIPCIGVRVVL